MKLYELILIGLSLSADAFAVSVTLGLAAKKLNPGSLLLPGAFFGAFQAGMPALGYLFARTFSQKIEAYDHWIALILLAAIGTKMIIDSLKNDDKEAGSENSNGSVKITRLFILAFATSIDALAVGVTLAFVNVGLIPAITLIGAITFVISTAGVLIGRFAGKKMPVNAGFIGGIVLILVGLKIFFEGLL